MVEERETNLPGESVEVAVYFHASLHSDAEDFF